MSVPTVKYSGQLPNSAVDLFSMTGFEVGRAVEMSFTNTSGSDVTVTIWTRTSAEANRQEAKFTLQASGGFARGTLTNLEALETVRAVASAAAAVDCKARLGVA